MGIKGSRAGIRAYSEAFVLALLKTIFKRIIRVCSLKRSGKRIYGKERELLIYWTEPQRTIKKAYNKGTQLETKWKADIREGT